MSRLWSIVFLHGKDSLKQSPEHLSATIAQPRIQNSPKRTGSPSHDISPPAKTGGAGAGTLRPGSDRFKKGIKDKHDRRTPSERKRQSKRQRKRERQAAREDSGERHAQFRLQKDQENKEAYAKDATRCNYGFVEDMDVIGDLEPLSSIDESRVGEIVRCRARVHAVRTLSSRLVFFLFRNQLSMVQGVLKVGHENGPSNLMVRLASKLPRESIVIFEGEVVRPEHGQPIQSAEVHGAEVMIKRLFLLSEVTDSLPFGVSEANRIGDSSNGGSGGIGLHTRLNHRPISLRVPWQHAILRTTHAATRAARSYLDNLGFLEIHSAKIQQGATESGASVFQIHYFQRAAYLAQSPQLAKEMAIGADLDRVYEIGPVFRAENSQTHRHLTEFTGLDIEMALHSDYHEVMRTIDGLLKTMFRAMQENCKQEIEIIKRAFPHDDFVFPEETVVLKFRDGVKMLRESGYRDEGEDENAQDMEDLSTRAEVRLGQLVKEKYNTDYFILDKFPTAARPFYTMPDPSDPSISNAFDIFVRGEEILSGGQRVHSARHMEARLKQAGIDPVTMSEYLEAFRAGMPPHGGGGIGLERLIMLFLKLGNIRHATMLPRDPKSFANNPPAGSMASAPGARLKVPEEGVEGWNEPDSLSYDPMKIERHPELVDLIAKYGDSTATAFTDPAYEIWRYGPTGAAIGFIPVRGHAITWGAPLCSKDDLNGVIREYMAWLSEDRHLSPIWLNVDEPTERILARQLGWSALIVTSEQVVTFDSNVFPESKVLRRKVTKAEREGVYVTLLEGRITKDIKEEIDACIRAWRANRKGEQLHTTEVRPWSDSRHRTYIIARNKENKACGIIVLHQLAPVNGYQIKWTLAFPGCPAGTSEYLVAKAIEIMHSNGVRRATFGAGARDTIQMVDNIKGIRAKVLTEVYNGIVGRFGLTRKSKFRARFGTQDEPMYLCYPHGGLGLLGPTHIIASVSEPAPAAQKAAEQAQKAQKKQEKLDRKLTKKKSQILQHSGDASFRMMMGTPRRGSPEAGSPARGSPARGSLEQGSPVRDSPGQLTPDGVSSHINTIQSAFPSRPKYLRSFSSF